MRADLSAELAAQVAVAVMDGPQVQWLLDPGAVDMEAAYQAFLALLVVDD